MMTDGGGESMNTAIICRNLNCITLFCTAHGAASSRISYAIDAPSYTDKLWMMGNNFIYWIYPIHMCGLIHEKTSFKPIQKHSKQKKQIPAHTFWCLMSRQTNSQNYRSAQIHCKKSGMHFFFFFPIHTKPRNFPFPNSLKDKNSQQCTHGGKWLQADDEWRWKEVTVQRRKRRPTTSRITA